MKEQHENMVQLIRYQAASIPGDIKMKLIRIWSSMEKNNSVTRIFGGAAPKEIWNEFEKRFDLTIVEGYGLTESATVCLCNPMENIKVGSIGKPLPHVSLKVVNEWDEEQPPREPGEIIVRENVPYTQFGGYYKMPEKTEEAMKNGWFHTGDRGYTDEDGYFYFLDRIKDCIFRVVNNKSTP